MFLVEHRTVFIYRNLFGSTECLVMLLTSTLEINYWVISTINSAKPFLNFIDGISINFQNAMLDLNLLCNKAYRNLDFMVTYLV